MDIKTIRGADEDTWRRFKILAAKTGVSMATLLKAMVKEFEKSSRKFWRELLEEEKLLSNEEAEDMLKISREIRVMKGFRE
jgi:hypothetical protein